MPTAQELIDAGFTGYQGWPDAEANANFQATGGVGKEGGGSSSGGSQGSTGFAYPALDFDWNAKKNEILTQLTPYYESLLKMYNGDIALAKQHMDKDYERGLRVQSEKTAQGLEENAADVAERKRKFDIALKDMGETMNSRGIYGSGIQNKENKQMSADEQYQQGLLKNSADALNKGLEYYKEEVGSARDKQLEKWGMKPVSDANNPTGEFAPSNEGLNTTGFTLNNFVSGPAQEAARLAKLKEQEAITQTDNAYNRAFTNWQTQINQLNS